MGPPKDHGAFREAVRIALPCYFLTSLVVVMGVILGQGFFQRPSHPLAKAPGFVRAFANWDGLSYEQIAVQGYFYDPEQASNVAYFPAYPLMARVLIRAFDCPPLIALLIVSQVCAGGAFLVLFAYVRQRFADQPIELASYSVLALGLFPATLYFRMAYTESLFILLTLLVFYGMERQWNLFAVAAIIGLATATRPVGLALVAPFLLHLGSRSTNRWGFLARAAALLPVAAWGILAYMAFQYLEFGDPRAFVKAQDHYHMRRPVPASEKARDLLILKPMWSLYEPSSPCYYGRLEHIPPVFSLYCANPIYWLLAGGLIVLGGVKRWLNGGELTLAALLLVPAYLGRGHEACMCSQARYASAVFPLYLVLGKLLVRLPPPFAAVVLSLSGLMLAIYSAAFATWYLAF